MKYEVGTAAGQIWTVLSEAREPISITEIPKLTRLKSQVAYQALGWLARENKVTYHKKGKKNCVCLT